MYMFKIMIEKKIVPVNAPLQYRERLRLLPVNKWQPVYWGQDKINQPVCRTYIYNLFDSVIGLSIRISGYKIKQFKERSKVYWVKATEWAIYRTEHELLCAFNTIWPRFSRKLYVITCKELPIS